MVKKKAVPPLHVLSVASEMYPFIKTGGLADVVGALPFALNELVDAPQKIHVTTLIPGYLVVLAALTESSVALELPHYFGGSARILRGTAAGVDLFVLDAPHLFSRAGNPYSDASGNDWQDNPERFAALSLAAAMLGWGAVKSYLPEVIHAHDWQTALTPAYVHYLGASKHQPKTVLTIHNLAFQGQFPAKLFARLGLPDAAYGIHGVEYYGGVGYLKAGIQFANAITTVSPTYATEICTPAGGMGLDGLLRARGESVSGVVNGIDMAIWNPANDAALSQTFDAQSIEQRSANKRAVEAHFNLPHSDAPLLCVVSRLTWQKGIDLIIEAIDEIVASNTRLVVLGNGDKALEAALYAAVAQHPTHVGVHIGYDEGISHLMQGGCDGILVPSRFEPCGLTQLYGLRYGCVPIVAKVGGLADTVIDANDAAVTAGVATGVQFHDVSKNGLLAAIARTTRLYHQPDIWRSIQSAGMRSDVAWRRSAAQYARLYRGLL
ncbi:MAG: glycogen synthase GlgA [Formosimonas sp.]